MKHNMDPDESSLAASHNSYNTAPQNQSSNAFSQKQKGENSSFLDYGVRFSGFNQPSDPQNSLASNMNSQKQIIDPRASVAHESNKTPNWDPTATLNNLSFLERKIHQLQDMVHVVVGRRSQGSGRSDELLAQQQQLITADLTSIIVQLISTAGSLLPLVKNGFPSASESQMNPLGQFSNVTNPGNPFVPSNNHVNKVEDHPDNAVGTEHNCPVEDHDTKSDDDGDEGEHLPPGSYEILQLEKEEILAPHTHFCAICGKGFKRDANLRMHMRGHGDEYKTPAALAKPHTESSSEPVLMKRYSCPFVGCKRNKEHKKFQPLKTILCVKNHYKRTHCDKTYTCSRCNTKKFSVIADLKTHEKHCGRDKWICSCGTTFSRKDKLFGHITLFQGHTPAIPLEECKVASDLGQCSEAVNKVEQFDFNLKSDAPNVVINTCQQNIMDVDGSSQNPTTYFSPLGFDTNSMGGFDEFPKPPFEDTESSFSFLLSGSSDYPPKNGTYADLDDME